jgi:hypothetical protein
MAIDHRVGSWLLAALVVAAPGCYRGTDGGADPGAGEGDGTAGDAGSDAAGDDDAGDGSDDGVAAGCEDDAAPRATLLRMSRTSYVGALEEIFGAAAIEPVQGALSAMPSTHVGVFTSEQAAATYSEVSAQIFIASQLAYSLTQDDAALESLSSCLPAVPPGADAASDPCLSDFIDAYGRRILRRPLEAEDRTRLSGDYAVGGGESVNEGIATLLIALLIDPEFLYYTETRGEEVAPGILELTPHEVATRLARVLWSSIPDEELLAAADAGLDEEMLAEQIDRMLDDERAHAAVAEFYRDWLGLQALPFPSEALFPDPEVRDELRAAMEAELLDFVRATTLDREGTWADLLLDRTATFDSATLAEVYGVAAGSDVALPEGERAGLLTRAAFLATPEIRGTNAGHLIKRGNRLGALICRPLPLPDPDNFPQADPADPESDPEQGIRERFAAATAEPQCASCHVQLDGLGAPLGHYGSTGEWIAAETIELPSGAAAELPIDTASEIVIDEDPIAVADGIALSEALATSRTGTACFAQQLTRNIVARELEPEDECMVGIAERTLAPEGEAPGSIRAALVQLLSSEQFRRSRTP